MSTSLRRRVLGAILLPLPLMLGVCLLFAWQVNRLNDRARWVAHTDEVIAWVHLCQKLMLDQETGLRGYLIAGQSQFLEPYKLGVREFPHCVEELNKLTLDSPDQQQRVVELGQQYQRWRTLADPALAEALPSNRDVRVVQAASNRKALMDQLRVTTDDIVTREKRLLAERRAASDSESRNTILGLVAIMTALGLFLIYFIHRITSAIDQSYSTALEAREASEARERQARLAAEALAAEITERSREMEKVFTVVRSERDAAFLRLQQLESNS